MILSYFPVDTNITSILYYSHEEDKTSYKGGADMALYYYYGTHRISRETVRDFILRDRQELLRRERWVKSHDAVNANCYRERIVISKTPLSEYDLIEMLRPVYEQGGNNE